MSEIGNPIYGSDQYDILRRYIDSIHELVKSQQKTIESIARVVEQSQTQMKLIQGQLETITKWVGLKGT
jgi:arginyl-tRNA--protein-N-Asp/Glu arginylyltransferase